MSITLGEGWILGGVFTFGIGVGVLGLFLIMLWVSKKQGK